MIAEEKAKELVEKMRLKMPPTIIPTASTKTNQLSCNIDLKGGTKNAKQCALIAVDELIESHLLLTTTHESEPSIRCKRYWQEVKQELEKL
jgi:hypothetical protein